MESCAGKFAKYFLFAYNLIFVLAGAGVLGVGIWIRVDPNFEHLIQILGVSSDKYLYGAAYILIGIGSFVFLVGFLGCCGALMENKCLLSFYIFFLALVFVGELGGGIAAAVFKGKVLEQLQPNLKVTIAGYKPKTNTTPENTVALGWDYVQVLFKCCGATNYTDYRGITFTDPTINVPKSCCALNNSDPSNPQPKDYNKCNAAATQDNIGKANDYLWTKNCIQGIEDTIKANLNILIGVGIGVAFLQILGIALACCVCRGGKNRVDKH